MKYGYWVYGVLAGVLLVVLQAIEYKAMIRDIRLEVFGGVIALIFTGVGIWVGIHLMHRKERLLANRERAKASSLSDRELEVLTLLASGHSNQEVADRLFISLNTAKTHISSIYQKLNVTRRTQAVQKAMDLSIIGPPDRVK